MKEFEDLAERIIEEAEAIECTPEDLVKGLKHVITGLKEHRALLLEELEADDDDEIEEEEEEDEGVGVF